MRRAGWERSLRLVVGCSTLIRRHNGSGVSRSPRPNFEVHASGCHAPGRCSVRAQATPSPTPRCNPARSMRAGRRHLSCPEPRPRIGPLRLPASDHSGAPSSTPCPRPEGSPRVSRSTSESSAFDRVSACDGTGHSSPSFISTKKVRPFAVRRLNRGHRPRARPGCTNRTLRPLPQRRRQSPCWFASILARPRLMSHSAQCSHFFLALRKYAIVRRYSRPGRFLQSHLNPSRH